MSRVKFIVASLLSSVCLLSEVAIAEIGHDPRDDGSPWGMATGAEWSHEYPRFHPLISKAGARWVRTFPEWVRLQPAYGVWKWDIMDDILTDLRKNNLHTIGTWCFFAKFASADGGTRKGPIRDIQFWKDYVTGTVERYHRDIKYWEVWNEFNGSFYQGPEKPKAYAELVVAAYDAAKAVDPTAMIGIGTASTDVGFLDLTIKAGAAKHFDYIIVHPYENIDAMRYGDESGYLGLVKTIREMLAENGEKADLPIWITEIGAQAPVTEDPKADLHQAEILAKAYLLSLAQGFERVYWFEIRGPTYGNGTDFGIIRENWSPRPSFHAFENLTNLLGPNPKYQGWINVGENGHGFLFDGAGGPVLALWSLPGFRGGVRFDGPVERISLIGDKSRVPAGETVPLDAVPTYFRQIPAELEQEARSNRRKPFPWGGDYAHAKEISCRFGEPNQDKGITQIFLRPDHENRSIGIQSEDGSARKVVSKDGDNNCLYLRADAGYLPYGTTELEVAVVAKRSNGGAQPKLGLTYEAKEGYKDFRTGGETWAIPAGEGWQEHTWVLKDACFANRWGWHVALINLGSEEFLLKEVRIKKR